MKPNELIHAIDQTRDQKIDIENLSDLELGRITTKYEKIKAECPAVSWKDSYLTLGRFDVVDIVESDDLKQLERAALIIRAHGHATTETLQGTAWKEFIATL